MSIHAPHTNHHFQQLLDALSQLGAEATRAPSADPLYQEFIERFPAERLLDLSLTDYCVGKGDGQSFCWWLERGLQPLLGRYVPGTSRGHVLYFQKDGSVYKHRLLSELGDADALQYTLRIQACIAQADVNADLHWIDDDEQLFERAGVEARVTVAGGRKLRLLSSYHPDDTLPISSSAHLGHFLRILGCAEADIPPQRQPVARMLRLREYLRLAQQTIPGLSPVSFMRALYQPELGLAPVADDEDGEVNSDEEISVLLTRGAIKNGYIRIPSLQRLFPSACIAADEQADAEAFTLALPDGSELQTCLLANRGRIKARFGALFKSLGCTEGDRVCIQHSGEGRYLMSIEQQDQDDETDMDAEGQAAVPSAAPPREQPLNQILYGPPGTGKTYATIDAALAVLDARFLDQHRRDRPALKARFDALLRERRIRFVTFHQSFSYEDFVEGLRAHSQDGQLQYRVEAGVFRQLCEDARTPPGQRSLNELLDDLLEQMAEQNVAMHTPTGKAFSASYSPGNDTIACLPERSTTGKPLPANIDHIRAVLQGQTVARIYCESYVRGIADFIKRRHAMSGDATARVSTDTPPYVLIIDEINRGNISRIFGELITLIEPSKRAGRDEALEVVLPYSKMPFSVPHNVYLIGTMNTADRSLTGMDVALRRRFVFKAMPPRADLLQGVAVEGIPVDELLSVMNQRIEALLDRDHCLGHAYFMPLHQTPTLDALAHIVRHQVLPLLQEYFFDDWQRIQWVLNDHRKAQAFQFVSARAVNVDALFGANVNVAHSAQAWSVNDDAFGLAESYLGVIDHREAQGDA